MSKHVWTDREREAASIRQKARWAVMSDQAKQDRQSRRYATYAARYPWQVDFRAHLRGLIEAGAVVKEPCDRCGEDGVAVINWNREDKTGELVGWRCYPCRERERAGRHAA